MSNKENTQNNNPSNSPIDFAVGGQAVIEGVLMRSPNFNVISVRSPAGKIVEDQVQYQTLVKRHRLLNIPVIRGVINMLEMMLIGTQALTFSSKQAMLADEPEAGAPAEDPVNESSNASSNAATSSKLSSETIVPHRKTSLRDNLMLGFSLVFALAMSIFLFKFLPLWITDFLSHNFAALQENYLLFNVVDGLIKTSFFLLYIVLLSFLPDVKRLFRYHGAEHKSIMTYEHGLDLTVENAKQQTRFHPRCGTSFIIIVFLISILVFTVIPRNPDFLTNFAIRLAFLPLVAGISYEFLKLSSKMPDNWFFKILIKPGLWMQKITTQEPDDQMLEVALNSLKLALQAEQNLLKQKADVTI
jgi:uncharacterized protein YqhQ